MSSCWKSALFIRSFSQSVTNEFTSLLCLSLSRTPEIQLVEGQSSRVKDCPEWPVLWLGQARDLGEHGGDPQASWVKWMKLLRR